MHSVDFVVALQRQSGCYFVCDIIISVYITFSWCCLHIYTYSHVFSVGSFVSVSCIIIYFVAVLLICIHTECCTHLFWNMLLKLYLDAWDMPPHNLWQTLCVWIIISILYSLLYTQRTLQVKVIIIVLHVYMKLPWTWHSNEIQLKI